MGRMEYFFTWAVAIGFVLHASESCEQGWVLYGRFDVCYKLFLTPHLDWTDATKYCVQQNAKLTDIYDYSEQMFIKNSVINKTIGHGVWLGASDRAENGDWRWVDNRKMDIDRFKWWEGNPNNGKVPDFFDDVFPGEDCLEISLKPEYRGQLNDFKCPKKMPFICKKKYISTTALPTTTQLVTSHPSSEPDGKSTIPVVATMVSLGFIAVLVAAIAIIMRRKRKQKSTNNYYEDANVSPPANENFYTCLETDEQTNEQDGATNKTFHNISIDDTSFHEYHSVCFPAKKSSAKSGCGDIYETNAEYMKPQTTKKF